MWKPKQSAGAATLDAVESEVPEPFDHTGKTGPRPSAVPTVTGETVIGKDLTVVGEISGDSPMFLDGAVEGRIDLPDARVTIGPNGRVTAVNAKKPCILAKEIVVLGKVVGTICGTDRVEIHPAASVTGDISTGRIAIADGAFFHGGIEILKTA